MKNFKRISKKRRGTRKKRLLTIWEIILKDLQKKSITNRDTEN